MSGRRAGAALIAGAIAIGGITTTADAKRAKPRAGTFGIQTAKVDVRVFGALHMEWSGARAANAPATSAKGYFTGTLSFNSSEIGHFAGPVTCLDVKGNRAGMFYPLTDSQPPGANAAIKGVYISIATTAKGAATGAGFMPTTSATTDSCDPDNIPASLPASGTAFVTGG